MDAKTHILHHVDGDGVTVTEVTQYRLPVIVFESELSAAIKIEEGDYLSVDHHGFESEEWIHGWDDEQQAREMLIAEARHWFVERGVLWAKTRDDVMDKVADGVAKDIGVKLND